MSLNSLVEFSVTISAKAASEYNDFLISKLAKKGVSREDLNFFLQQWLSPNKTSATQNHQKEYKNKKPYTKKAFLSSKKVYILQDYDSERYLMLGLATKQLIKEFKTISARPEFSNKPCLQLDKDTEFGVGWYVSNEKVMEELCSLMDKAEIAHEKVKTDEYIESIAEEEKNRFSKSVASEEMEISH